MLAKVHVAKKQLGMTDEGYRAMLYGLFEVDSAGNNDRVCGHTRPDWIEITDSMPHAPVKRQILVIWKKLGYSMGSLDTRVKRAFGIPVFVWMQDFGQLSTLLSDLQRREKAFDKKAGA